MNGNILERILAHKRDLIRRKRPALEALRRNIAGAERRRYRVFEQALSGPEGVRLIAEIKKASPSRGLIRKDFHVEEIARTYARAGAAAISVLTEDRFFMGKPAYVRRVSETVGLPVLTKDFIIDELQIYEAFANGAAAVLLIAALLEEPLLRRLVTVADSLDVDCLLEVHDEAEIERALAAGGRILGVNNRDLRTFEVDIAVCERLIPRIPKDRIVVAESGIWSRADVERMERAGAHAVLVGEALMRSPDITARIRELMGMPSVDEGKGREP